MFDTDVLMWVSRGNLRAARMIDAVTDAVTDRELSIVSLMELLQAARPRLEVRQIQQSLRQLQFRIVPLSESAGASADALIAATALESALPLCTGNVKHFRPIRALSRVAFRP